MKFKSKGPLYKRTCNGIERVRPVLRDRETYSELGAQSIERDYVYPIEVYKPTGAPNGN